MYNINTLHIHIFYNRANIPCSPDLVFQIDDVTRGHSRTEVEWSRIKTRGELHIISGCVTIIEILWPHRLDEVQMI